MLKKSVILNRGLLQEQLLRKNFCTKTDNLEYFNERPYWVTGFVDAEGSFTISIRKAIGSKLGWSVTPNFQIELHKKDAEMLRNIQAYFGGIGVLRGECKGREKCVFVVNSLNQIITGILPHFDKYPLITQKRMDYLLFKEIILMMNKKEHLQAAGLQTIVNIRASLNLGLSESLKEAFPTTIPVVKRNFEGQEIPHPYWLAGFASGEGSFRVKIKNSSSHRIGFQIILRFTVTQHFRDEQLLKSFETYLGCGSLTKRKGNFVVDYCVEKFSDLTDKIIPFFKQYPITGVKSADFNDICKVAELMKVKAHLTEEGLNQIRKIQEGMNRGRLY